MELKKFETKEQTAVKEAIDIIERKRFIGFTASERTKMLYAAKVLKRYLPQQVAIEGELLYCPVCNNEVPFGRTDVFNIYCSNCGQNICNDI